MIARLQPHDVDCLLRLPMLAELRPDELQALAAEAAVITYPGETLLFSAGDPADRCFAVVEGYVRLFALNNDGHDDHRGHRRRLVVRGGRDLRHRPLPGERRGGRRLAPHQRPRRGADAASARRSGAGAEDARLSPPLAAAADGRAAAAQGAEPGRHLAWYLLSLLEQTPGAASVTLPHRKGMIAARIGITPESLSRALARLGRLGVESEGNVVKIPDPEALRRFCQR